MCLERSEALSRDLSCCPCLSQSSFSCVMGASLPDSLYTSDLPLTPVHVVSPAYSQSSDLARVRGYCFPEIAPHCPVLDAGSTPPTSEPCCTHWSSSVLWPIGPVYHFWTMAGYLGFWWVDLLVPPPISLASPASSLQWWQGIIIPEGDHHLSLLFPHSSVP